MTSSPSDNNETKPVKEVLDKYPDAAFENLSNDPDYAKLNEHFQRGEKDLALMVMNTLEKRYPEHPELLMIKDELQMKSSVNNLTKRIEKGEKRESRREFLNLAIFAVIGTILALGAFYLTSQFLLRGTVEEQVDRNVDQLTSLQNQADQLLDRGRPQPASEIIETMRGINPNWEALPELTSRTETLLQLEDDYNQALELAEQGQNAEALVLFQSIEETQPGLWDVRSQIATMESKIQINTFLEQGQTAFQAGDWAGVISAYESALDLDPSMNDPRLKEQLIQAYLNEINRIVDDQNPSLEAIETAEGYYRRAAALIPQGGDFSVQRAQLEDLNDEIKELKYVRLAREIFSDPFQTLSMVNNAVAYMRQAAIINNTDAAMQGNLQNAEAYRAGFQSFVAMNWESAIQSFNQIINSNSGFLQDNARVLLYESYFGLGKQYASTSQYGNALTALESAETLALQDSDNLLKLFQVQVLIGDMFYLSGEPEAAFSSYRNAYENITINQRLGEFPEFAQNYAEAINLAENESYEGAYQNIQAVYSNINVIYTYSEVTVSDGASLAFIANNNKSTVNAINQANSLPNDVVVSFGGTLQVPKIEN